MYGRLPTLQANLDALQTTDNKVAMQEQITAEDIAPKIKTKAIKSGIVKAV